MSAALYSTMRGSMGGVSRIRYSVKYCITLGKPIMMFRVNLINYLVKLHLKCINKYCIRISEILCILKCVVMIDMKTRHILFW